jgi:hypothetical protein
VDWAGRQRARNTLHCDRAIVHDGQAHSIEYGVCIGAGRQPCEGDERKPTPTARGAIDNELDVGELHVDPGKGCVQLRFGETDAEAANVHAKWGRGTLESHNATITTTAAACFVPSAAMCLSKRLLASGCAET